MLGHTDISGNCSADELLRLEATLQIQGTLKAVNLCLSYCILIINEEVVDSDDGTIDQYCGFTMDMMPK